jgi:hypothetical protein
MSPLEKLGLEVAAFNLLGSRGKAALLCALINADGRTVSSEALKNARAWRMENDAPVTTNGLRTRMCWLREALEDVGLANVIVTDRDGRNTPCRGYAMPEPGRTAVIERLIEAAA